MGLPFCEGDEIHLCVSFYTKIKKETHFSTHKSPFSGHESPFSGHESPFSGHESPFSGHKSLFFGHESPFSGHMRPVFYSIFKEFVRVRRLLQKSHSFSV
jgi:hypothetical protein